MQSYPSELLSHWVWELQKKDLGPNQEKFDRLKAEWDDNVYGQISRNDAEFLSCLYADYT